MGTRLAKTDTPSFCSECGQIARHSEQVSSLKHADLPFSQELLGIASEQETRSKSGPVCVRLVRKTLQGQPPGRKHGLPARQAGRVPAGRGSLCCPRLRARIPEGVRSQGPPVQVYPKSGLMKEPGDIQTSDLGEWRQEEPERAHPGGKTVLISPPGVEPAESRWRM